MTPARKPWWLWRTHPSPQRRVMERVEQYVGKRKRVYEQGVEFMLELEYTDVPRADRARKFPGMTRSSVGASVLTREIKEWADTGHEGAIVLYDAVSVLSRWMGKTYDDRIPGRSGALAYQEGRVPTVYNGVVSHTSLGSMAVLKLRDIYTKGTNTRRAQRYDFLLTPPVYKFCDLTGVVPPSELWPQTFWIQPEVHAETGEIMEGSPIGDGSPVPDQDFSRGWARTKFAIGHDELQASLDGKHPVVGGVIHQRLAQIVRVALDAFLGDMTPDPRFLDPVRLREMLDR